MYSRSYEKTPPGIALPNDYCGTSLLGEVGSDIQDVPTEREDEASCAEEASAGVKDGILSSLFSRIRGVELGGFWERGRLLLRDFGTEEILILSVALLLLFSRERDFECGLMLLLLLFIR